MIVERASEARGRGQHGWLDSRHTFSFASYFDPKFMGFRTLRVINEDRVEPGRGFGAHSHQDMEIISYVLEGELAHRDSLGNGSTIRPGDVQRMSAGTGIQHSELNLSDDEVLHFLQIWITPAETGIAPSYEQRTFPDAERRGRLRLVVSPDRADGSLLIHQDARMLVGLVEPDEPLEHPLDVRRHAWVQVARGAVDVNGHPLDAGDGAAISGERTLRIEAAASSEILVFDLA
jgi:hypothetical protein